MLRHVHIPKTAGSALNSVIYKALGQRPVHIANVVDLKLENKKYYDLVRNSSAYNFARNNRYLSGHISYSDMKSLDGDFIFSVLRDPRQRFVSEYTYALTRIDRGRKLIGKVEDGNFLSFINARKAGNGVFKLLCMDFFRAKGLDPRDITSDKDTLHRLTIRALRRYDAIYFCSIQEILNDLGKRSLIPSCQEIVVNTSSEGLVLGNLGLRQTFLDRLDKLTYLDSFVMHIASELFPDTIKKQVLTNDEFIKYLEERFDCKFESEF